MALELAPLLPKPLTRISRAASSAPAVGSHTTHEHEQAELLQSVLLS